MYNIIIRSSQMQELHKYKNLLQNIIKTTYALIMNNTEKTY